MNAKIFPMKIINPNKHREIREAPPIHTTPPEDRAIMRELMKEAAAQALEKRVKALPPRSLKLVKPPIRIGQHTPEVVLAFNSLSRETKRLLMRKPQYKYMRELNEWLDKFQKGEEHFCASCGFDITSHDPLHTLVPYMLITVEINPLIIEGLCLECTGIPDDALKIKIVKNLNLNLL